ncbi:MAG: hypothetical protein GDA36_11615 [Rhodobacteraceae bacterium]|nr:hypothetical protein [Paracoccaceae bacterium]
MKKVTTAILASVAVVGLFGCQRTGNQSLKHVTNRTIGQELLVGMSMSQVRMNFGDPIDTTFTDGGLAIWDYELKRGQITPLTVIPVVNLFSYGMEGTKKQLTVLFDENEKVKKFTFSESEYQDRGGIVPQ